MVKIMRTFLPLAGLLLASGHDQMKCALKSLGAVDELLDAAIYIWAATERCEHAGEAVRCEVDIASAVESVNGMINVILKTTDKCGSLNIEHPKCGMAAGVLTKTVAGLAAASGGLLESCPKPGRRLEPAAAAVPVPVVDPAPVPAAPDAAPVPVVDPAPVPAAPDAAPVPVVDPAPVPAPVADPAPVPAPVVDPAPVADPAPAVAPAAPAAPATPASLKVGRKCVVDVKHSLKSLFKSIKYLMQVKSKCAKNSHKCAKNSIKVVAALAGLGEYLAGIVGHCVPAYDGNALCASSSAQMVQELSSVAKGGVELAHHCHLSESRLYALEDEDDETEMPEDVSSSPMTLALAAMLPLAAVLGFVGGSRLSKATSETPTRDLERLMTREAVEE